jgi:hypothetical protein
VGTKPRKPAPPPESSNTPSEIGLPERGSVQRKAELVLRLLRAQALDAVSPEVQVPAHEPAQGLKTRSDPEAPSSRWPGRKSVN